VLLYVRILLWNQRIGILPYPYGTDLQKIMFSKIMHVRLVSCFSVFHKKNLPLVPGTGIRFADRVRDSVVLNLWHRL
jgi:hypothetical protein